MKTRPMVGYHRAGSRMEQNTTLGSRAPRPHDSIGFSPSKIGNFTDCDPRNRNECSFGGLVNRVGPLRHTEAQTRRPQRIIPQRSGRFFSSLLFPVRGASPPLGTAFLLFALQPLSFRLATARSCSYVSRALRGRLAPEAMGPVDAEPRDLSIGGAALDRSLDRIEFGDPPQGLGGDR
jgi:hypothetical protein